ncbi:hypothetical protein COCON_G00110780 [Conger conger]|uniref:Uncharacterized protein n=1 Tax=Conger conger TaxID=82655 RepID=A0A9Q1HZX5_CONCO|nr:hypothetical protein COCON_G00110780 [Conger conger]
MLDGAPGLTDCHCPSFPVESVLSSSTESAPIASGVSAEIGFPAVGNRYGTGGGSIAPESGALVRSACQGSPLRVLRGVLMPRRLSSDDWSEDLRRRLTTLDRERFGFPLYLIKI